MFRAGHLLSSRQRMSVAVPRRLTVDDCDADPLLLFAGRPPLSTMQRVLPGIDAR